MCRWVEQDSVGFALELGSLSYFAKHDVSLVFLEENRDVSSYCYPFCFLESYILGVFLNENCTVNELLF